MLVKFVNVATGVEKSFPWGDGENVSLNYDTFYVGRVAVAVYENFRWHLLNIFGDVVSGEEFTDIHVAVLS